MDLMTGFTGKKPPDLDLGLKGEDYFAKWTTVSLPDTGKNSSVDDEQQPSGSGAPATSIPGPPLKVPMEASDVERPKIREGREAKRAQARVLRKVAAAVRRLDPVTARRLMAAADEITYDALSTAALPESGDESNEVDDTQDNLGHGKLQFYGTDPAKSTSLSRESSRRRTAGDDSPEACVVSYKLPGKNWAKKSCKTAKERREFLTEMKAKGAETRIHEGDRDKADVKTNMQYASRGASRRRRVAEIDPVQLDNQAAFWSRKYPGVDPTVIYTLLEKGSSPEAIESYLQSHVKENARMQQMERGQQQQQRAPAQRAPVGSRGASRRRNAEVGGDTNARKMKWDSLDLVSKALDGQYDRGAVAKLLEADYNRAVGLLKGGGASAGGGGGGGGTTSAQPAQTQASRRARTQGDKPLKPQPTVGDQDGPGADGAGGFYKRSKAPLQETMAADDVERPKIRENPEAARLGSLWDAFRAEIVRQASGGGKWNAGHYAIEARDYGDSVEVLASVVDRENLPMPVGSMLFSKLHDSPRGRYATVEVNDGILENRTTEFTLRKSRQASRLASRVVAGIAQMAKDVLDEVTV